MKIMGNFFDIPAWASNSDPVWQAGYRDGETPRPPWKDDATYISGWCHGHNALHQCPRDESEKAYLLAIGAALADWMPREYSPEDLLHLMGHLGAHSLRPMSTAPTDGKYIVCVELELPTPGVIGHLMRVPEEGLTNEFLEADIEAEQQDEQGRGAQYFLGWLPVPIEWPVIGDPRRSSGSHTLKNP